MVMKRWKAALAAMLVMGSAGAAHAGSVTLYSQPHFRGDRITIRGNIDHLDKLPPWNDRARSLVVNSGTWEICKDKKYDHCRTLAAGARVSDVAEVKNLRGGVTSLREIGGRDDRDWDWDRDRDRDQWGWNQGPPPPPQRHDDGIVWDGGGGGSSYGYDQRVTDRPQNSCQSQVERAFIDRYGRGRSRFAGDSVEGTIWWENEPWRYRCAGGRTNIWR